MAMAMTGKLVSGECTSASLVTGGGDCNCEP
uniref:Uncharacterized protein n=1 Tax=Rhizophora mucronata TaxID=61149 RepID=A0A2P2QRP4_RHIMU